MSRSTLRRRLEVPIEWPVELRFRRGARVLLQGLGVYYDFEWSEVFGHNRATFLRGEDLAISVKEACPRGLTPLLLLTVDPNAEERSYTTEKHYVVVVRIRDYLRSARLSTSHATNYFARQVKDDIFGAAGRRFATLSDEQLAAAINFDALRAWASDNADASAVFSRLVRADSTLLEPSAVASVVRGVAALDLEIIEAIAQRIGSDDSEAARRTVLETITASTDGRQITSEVLTSRLEERFDDVRRSAAEFGRLLRLPEFNETKAQSFIEDNPWLIGLDYAQVRERQQLPRGELDFILERYDGFHDVLELKSPQDPIIETRTSGQAPEPPTPSRYSLSRELGHALAQAHAYRELLTSDASVMERSYGLRSTEYPRLIVVVGRYCKLSEMQRQILRQLNLSMRRVEVIPYDLLAARAERLVADLERHLSASVPPQQEQPVDER